MRNVISTARVVVAALGLIALTAGNNQLVSHDDEDSRELPPAAIANPHVSLELIESLPEKMQKEGDLYIDSAY